MPITILDLVLLAVMLISGLLAMVRGFMREILSIAAWGAAALVAAIGLRSLPVVWRRVAGGTAIALGILQVSMTLFLVPTPPTLPGMILPMTLGRAPSRADWQHDRILADIGRESGGKPVTVAVIPNDNFFDSTRLLILQTDTNFASDMTS